MILKLYPIMLLATTANNQYLIYSAVLTQHKQSFFQNFHTTLFLMFIYWRYKSTVAKFITMHITL